MQLDPMLLGTSSPFRMSFPPREAFAHASWQRARLKIESFATQGERVVLVGEPGTGKTLFLQDLDWRLRKQNLGVRKLQLGDPLQEELSNTDVLLIDEADRLGRDQLKRICDLPNALIMAGLPSLIERLPSGIRRFHFEQLEPLQPEDIARFVRSRMAGLEQTQPSFTPEAILALMRQSAGLFRLVTILAGSASFFARQRGSSEITALDVDDAASLRASAFENTQAETLPDVATADRVFADLHAVPSVQTEPARVDVGVTIWRLRQLKFAGWASWACASFAVVIAAIIAARTTTESSRSVLQKVAERPVPILTAASRPDLLPGSRVPLLPRSPAQVVTTPAPAVAGLPSPPEPTALLEGVQAEVTLPPLQNAVSEPLLLVPAGAERPRSAVAFTGQILNETMGQGGKLSLKLMTNPVDGPVEALFHASHGLIGTGMLNGAIGPRGKVSLTGRLMMGSNPFDCTLSARLEGDRLVGEAIFVRQTTGSIARSRFSLSRV